MPASDPSSATPAAIATAEQSDRLSPPNRTAARAPTSPDGNAGPKGKKPAWNVPPGASPEAVGPVMGAATWPSLTASTRASAKPSTPSSSSDSLKSLSDGSAASAASALVEQAVQIRSPSPPTKLNPTNITKRSSVPTIPNGRSPKWGPRTGRGNYNNINYNNNYNSNSNNGGGGIRGRRDHGQNYYNNNNNNSSWNSGRPRHFFRPSPPPPPPPFGFNPAPPVPAFFSPVGFTGMQFPYPMLAPVPLVSPQFAPQMAPPVFVTAEESEHRNAILKQIEYYFSTENLCKDVFLRKNMDEQGWVHISLIASFNRVKQLTTNAQYILDVVQNSSIVEVQGDKVRRRNDWMHWILPPSPKLGLGISGTTNRQTNT